jgi:permuted papain-like amidase YaeF/Yiix C92 family enzyme
VLRGAGIIPLRKLNPFHHLRAGLTNYVIHLLTKPLRRYTVLFPNDIVNLRRHIRKGDVVLIEGNERISECIKYLTQSSWSHSALFVGDEPLRRWPGVREDFEEKYGEDAEYLLVEALVESGVVLSPLSKYRDFNIRICRPFSLSAADLRNVLDEALKHVGDNYDIKNIVDLLRFFLPVSFVPRRFRQRALRMGSGEPTRVICSGLIAQCFSQVNFPVVPSFAQPPQPSLTRRVIWRLALSRGNPYGVMKRVPPTLITPRDFDLSPYFETVKFNVIENLRFDYRRILWANDDQELTTTKKPA